MVRSQQSSRNTQPNSIGSQSSNIIINIRYLYRSRNGHFEYTETHHPGSKTLQLQRSLEKPLLRNRLRGWGALAHRGALFGVGKRCWRVLLHPFIGANGRLVKGRQRNRQHNQIV